MEVAVLEAASRGDVPRLRSLLRTQRANVDAIDENGCSALQRAAADGHAEVVELLLQHGGDPNKQDHVHGNSAIHEAAWKGYSASVARLAEGGARLCVRNAGGFTALHLASQAGHNQSARNLLLAAAHPDLPNNYGDTALHTAARYGHAGVTRILISAQCKVSEQNKNGDTALHIAAAMGRRKLTRILLEAGCDKTLKNHQGETARDIATRKGLEEIINILNTPISKLPKKKDRSRDKSKERTIDEPDTGNKKDKEKTKDKKKKNVHFDVPPPVQWSPYGCHYYPDPKYFPKPRLSSLPTEPLKKGEQYYLDLAGNIKKGPIGAGYTCYCAPFFKHMENKLNEDKKDLKRHIDKAHERLDQKVSDLEIKTQGQISELTKFVAAERAMCKERHEHLEHWLTRGMLCRASERVKKFDGSSKGSIDMPSLKRTRSLELLDVNDWNRVNRIIKKFNQNAEQNEYDAKELNETRTTSKSTELLNVRRSPSPKQKYLLKTSKSSDHLDSGPSRKSQSPHIHFNDQRLSQNVIAEIHTKSNRISMSQSPASTEMESYNVKYISPNHTSQSKSSNSSIKNSEYKASDSECDIISASRKDTYTQSVPAWKSEVLQRTAEDLSKKIMFDKEHLILRNQANAMNISQDGYIRIPKQDSQMIGGNEIETEPIKPVQELVAKVELQQFCNTSEPLPLPRRIQPAEIMESTSQPLNIQPSHSILKPPQQPQRPAPVLKEKPCKSKRFSFHNLIPFPTRKSFQTSPKTNGNNSESSDEEDNPIRALNQPGPMRNSNLLQTLPMPNYETMSNISKSPVPQVQPKQIPYSHELMTMIPKDAYFHDIPSRPIPHQIPYRNMTDSGPPLPQYTYQTQNDFNETGLPPSQYLGRNRNPLHHHETGVFDAMMKDHIVREMDRTPQCYSEHLDQNTEVEIAKQNDHFHNYYCRQPYTDFRNQGVRKPIPDHSLLHSRLQSLAINTQMTEIQSQMDRESHNDSGYSTKVYGSSQGPSPSLSGYVENNDNISGQRIIGPSSKLGGGQGNASSLV